MNRLSRTLGRTMPMLVLAVLTASGCVSQRSSLPTLDDEPLQATGEYVIGPGDQVQVRVWKSPELSVEVPVRPDGNISVPLLDDVHAAGKTAHELKELIASELDEYISDPHVTVVVTQMNSKRIYVLGEVVRSGPVLLLTPMRITDAISTAGGFGPFADKGDVKLIRHSAGGEQEYVFDYDAYVAGRAPGTNLPLQPGDTIVVPD